MSSGSVVLRQANNETAIHKLGAAEREIRARQRDAAFEPAVRNLQPAQRCRRASPMAAGAGRPPGARPPPKRPADRAVRHRAARRRSRTRRSFSKISTGGSQVAAWVDVVGSKKRRCICSARASIARASFHIQARGSPVVIASISGRQPRSPDVPLTPPRTQASVTTTSRPRRSCVDRYCHAPPRTSHARRRIRLSAAASRSGESGRRNVAKG